MYIWNVSVSRKCNNKCRDVGICKNKEEGKNNSLYREKRIKNKSHYHKEAGVKENESWLILSVIITLKFYKYIKFKYVRH